VRQEQHRIHHLATRDARRSTATTGWLEEVADEVQRRVREFADGGPSEQPARPACHVLWHGSVRSIEGSYTEGLGQALDQVLQQGPRARTEALLRLLIGEIRVVSPTDIRPTYRVPADVRIPEELVGDTGFEPVTSRM
jgi:hypothetical protein